MFSYQLNLTEAGSEAIRQFIASGGSYFGICGGALYATDYLGLCAGSWSTDIPGMTSTISLIEMTVHREGTSPDLSDEPKSYQTLYWSSSFFIPVNPSSIIPIMSYRENYEPGMFLTRYGRGTVFCSSPHPEYEEGDSRDGTIQYDYINDPDSEWGLLQKVTQWLINESPDAPSNHLGNLGGIVLIGVVTIIVVLFGAIYSYRRRQTIQ